MTRALTDFGLT